MSKRVFETTLAGKPLRVEIGEVAKQANGSAMIHYGDTVVLSTVVAKSKPVQTDFFPLMVIYQEKLYAAGKIPGGFLRREGRPSELETLTSRLIDRPIRPLFDEGYTNDVQIVNTVLSSDPLCSSQMAAMLGSSIVLEVSNIPFLGPIAGAHVGRVNGEFVLNPSAEQLEVSDIDLIVAGTTEAINMVEAGAKQVSEADMLEAILFGHAAIKELCAFQKEIKDAVGLEKVIPELNKIDQEIFQKVMDFKGKELIKAVAIIEKQERYDAIDSIKEEIVNHFDEINFVKEVDGIKVLDMDAKATLINQVKSSVDRIVTKEVRRLITEDKVRPDGRKVDEIRDLSSRIDVLPRTHGSALFTRGQTQALGVVTLGSLGENQIIDGLETVEVTKRFMLHYNFPPFSVGETGRYGAPGRREIGHGALGERALLQVLPSEVEFPYSIRIVSEILESNGSSSQATICVGSMALMAAGVPIKAPVAGIAMGLIKEGDYYTILSDIQGMEDHEGDMDFKVAGTKDGITALQMDIKITGITTEIMQEALEQARKGRLHILNHMNETISVTREELSDYAPKVKMIQIKPDKIRDVIGSGGKIITQIIEDHNNVKIDIEQDGRVFIMHNDSEWIKKAALYIENLVREAKVGEIYEAKITRLLMDKEGKKIQGAFAEIFPGTEGLIHISKWEKERTESLEGKVSVGDQVIVKVVKIDEKGRVDLSRKDAI
ncbi:Polyribonucleotide nucleotidyltransferase [Acholeplasma oculi]|uniref:Polyribonucleotide nucleotidyltransferase n=1 Tax=Acholeplasma oculi TaxID=35623 RepID=A0A061AAW3_9MOLU|nr:polyribonucleotide nucleotidyltransferase [Acholeplasma oculi]CDR30988.1 Polyribonucleotide nucleotidyltransferase [Acholeplasma oculi]SKC36086.1 polyribonucleotide nucleotidyltransferase [Acholeplasma oculi]SUT90389.1 Polyribonucleotide nucleotidyltransferase [Acholeplasma oculi]